MRFENGMLGVCIVVIAIITSVGGAYALSMDVEEVEVTNYSMVTDITGVFDSSKAVTYIEYEPSTNFTGYYTSSSNGYFDGVNYTQSNKINNYKLNLAPTSSVDSTVTLTSLTSDKTNPATVKIDYATGTSTVDCYPNYVTFSEFLQQENLTGADSVKLSANVTSVDWTSGNGGWFTFAPKSWGEPIAFNPGNMQPIYVWSFKNPNISMQDSNSRHWHNPILSAIWDGSSLELFYGADFTNSAGLFSTSDVYVFYSAGSGSLTLSDTAKLSSVTMPDAVYMDVSKGVTMED